MTRHTITRGLALVASRLTALVAGCICVACAGAILFEDVVMKDAAIELPHILTAGILSIALLAGHLRIEARREGRWPAWLGFWALFLAATALVVYQSSGKQTETTVASQAEADLAAEERKRLRGKIDEAEFILASCPERSPKKWFGERCGLRDARTKECASGNGTACQGKAYSVGTYEAAIKGHTTDLDRLGPPKPVAAEADNIANIAAVFGADREKVRAGAILAVPFIRTILFELGGLWCLGFAFRPLPERKETKPATGATVAKRAPLSPAEQSVFGGIDTDVARQLGIGGEPGTGNWGNPGNGGTKPAPKPGNGGNGGGRQVLSSSEALLDLTRRLASGETVAAQDELAAAWGVDKSTVSKWLKRWRADERIPAAQRVGRCHRLVAAE